MKEIVWIGSSKKDLIALPIDIIRAFGYGLYIVQEGDKPVNSKPLKGFGNISVQELIEYDDKGTYRAVYTIEMKGILYVLHVFQKKSKHNIATPKQEIDLIKSRLKLAREIQKERSEKT